MKIQYVNPAGNITAIVEGFVPMAERISLSKKILDKKCAEQVGFETAPALGGLYRLEMMGGEFCGNAARSFGYLKALEEFGAGVHTINVEISGAEAPVPVMVDLDKNTAFARMPVPARLEQIEVQGYSCPVVMCHGICHLIALDVTPDEVFVETALDAMKSLKQDAYGIMFLDARKGTLIPAVYVAATDSLVWESSCGSGSVACGWYLAMAAQVMDSSETKVYTFAQPGGTIQVEAVLLNGRVTACIMGGEVNIIEMK
ncbi:MAG: hypothetical protein IJ324_11785 [Lachnospiraceae bacterium]|nr:hypothetical protein [Lachnospiraceae bacterium]